MCTRFYLDYYLDEYKELLVQAENSATAERFMARYAKPLKTSGEIRPTDVCPVIAPDSKGNRAVFAMKWGFTLPGSKQPLVNARVETAADKPTFSESWRRHRCIIPASWYYEWQHYKTDDGKNKTGDRYLIQPKDSSATWLGGLYRIEDDLPVFTVLTKAPTEELARIHDRMPLILPEKLIDDWISPSSDPGSLLSQALNDMNVCHEGPYGSCCH